MSYRPVGSMYGAPAPAGSLYGAPVGSPYGAPGSIYGGPAYASPASYTTSSYGTPVVPHTQSVTQAVPHTTYGTASYTQPVTHSTTTYETVGYQPVIRTREREQGIGKAPGKKHHAPWHKKYNYTDRRSTLEERPIQVPVTTTHTDYHTRTVPTASTHVDTVTTTTTDWHPVR